MTNLLHGREVEVNTGDSIHVCVIRSGCSGEHPFEAYSPQSGRVHRRFSANQAKNLRNEGSALNMELIS